MKKLIPLIIVFLLIVPLFGGTGEASPPPTRTRPPTKTPRPTRTQVVTNTAVPTGTPTSTAQPTPTPSPTPPGDCNPWPNDTPAGSLPSQLPPVFCLITNSGPGTEQSGPNSWHDNFNHGLSLADMDGAGYRVYNEIGAWRSIFWRHNNHWMVDLAPHPDCTNCGWWDKGYTMLRPDMSFNFINDKLVVESTVAAGMAAYQMDAWVELVVSNGPAPSQNTLDLYGYDLFPYHYTLGCRLQPSRVPICALKSNDGTDTQTSTRIWEMAFWLPVGTESYGGYPGDGLENYWHTCDVDEPDELCQDHFRLELSRTSLELYSNDELYFAQWGIPPLPDELLNGDVYVYLVSAHIRHPADTIRYHWDDFAVNNED